MMSELTVQGSNQNRPFKPKNCQDKRRGQSRNYYDQDRYQNDTDQTVGIEECHIDVELRMDKRERLQYDKNYRSDFRRGNFRGM